jgi:hypothetical protein
LLSAAESSEVYANDDAGDYYYFDNIVGNHITYDYWVTFGYFGDIVYIDYWDDTIINSLQGFAGVIIFKYDYDTSEDIYGPDGVWMTNGKDYSADYFYGYDSNGVGTQGTASNIADYTAGVEVDTIAEAIAKFTRANLENGVYYSFGVDTPYNRQP